MSDNAGGPENAVHFYRRDADTQARPAGSFLGAFIKHSGVDAFYCQSQDSADYDDFVGRIAKADQRARPCHFVAPGSAKGFAPAPVLRIADPAVAPLAWRRRTLGQRRYSIVGEITDLGAGATHRALGELLVAPLQPWDALIFPSKTVKAAAERLLEQHAAYLAYRFGGNPKPDGLHFVIPPGIETSKYADTADSRVMRSGVRRRLGIRDDDLCVLSTGNFAFHERAHPTPLYLALEAAARRTGVRIHLLQAGWFQTERIERAYRNAVRDYAPAINAIFLDGREADIRERVWFAADAYAAFDDSVRHGLDTELCEAMAAGLPVVASDWGANRDVVRAGQEGYLIPSWLPLAESGGDLALAPEIQIAGGDEGRADTFMSGTLSQMTALDLRAAAEAFEALAGNPERRRSMGEAARKRARETYDWPLIIRRHQALWAQLRMIRADAAEVAPPVPGRQAVTLIDDPFSAYAPFATNAVGEATMVTLAKGLKGGEGIKARLDRLRANAINDIAGHALLDPAEQEHLLAHLSERDGMEVLTLAGHLAERRRYRLPRTLVGLAKMG
ncbi:MAG: glycosyltransferase, partial [Proteobacteria bacterium]|nr:glycosyltransferase [Pseudomonadota bacterium]